MGLFNLSKSKGENLGNIYSSKKQFIYLRLELYLSIKQSLPIVHLFSVSVLISPGMIYFVYLYFSIFFLVSFPYNQNFYLLIRVTIFLFSVFLIYIFVLFSYLYLFLLYFSLGKC